MAMIDYLKDGIQFYRLFQISQHLLQVHVFPSDNENIAKRSHELTLLRKIKYFLSYIIQCLSGVQIS